MNTWKVCTIQDVCMKKGLVRGPFGGALKKEIFVESGYKVYEQKNAIYKTFLEGKYFISEAKFKELKRFEVLPGDFIISCSGTIGEIYEIPEEAPKGIINQALLKLRLNNNILSEYFKQYFRWDSFQRKITDNTQGGALKNLVGMNIFKKMEIPLPALQEQKQIADILSTWDHAIELKENEIRQEKDLLQRAINSLVKENEVLNVQYEKIMLHDCMEFVNGYAFESKNYIDNGDFKVITIGNVQDGMLNIHSNTKFISVLPGNVNKKQKLQKNDILISMTGNVGRVCLVDQDNCVLNQRVGKLIPLDNIHPMYLYYALRSKKFLYKMIAKAQGGAQPNLSTKDIKNHRISVPKLEFQKKIANYLYNLEKQTIFRSREIEKLKLQKKGLMQRLLTGQVRVQL